ncbi:MAG: FtsX-like permease family protein [Actinomycetota bacterium]
MTVVGIALGVAVLLGALSVFPALRARDARQAHGEWLFASQRHDDVLLIEPWNTTFHDRPLLIQHIAPVGDAPMPGGLKDFPAPGTIVASPALAEILRRPDRDQLAERLPGTLVGEIGDEGLVEPHELRAYVGAAPDDLRRAFPVTRFGAYEPKYETDPVVMAVMVAAIAAATAGVIVPVLVFVWTVTRLGAASRESRLAALRLLGASPAYVRLIVALEVGIAAVAGTALGAVSFGVGRYLVPWEAVLPANTGLFPADVRPPLGEALLLLTLVPLAAVAVAWVTLRRVVGQPMEVRRRAPVRSLGVVLGATTLVMGISCWIVVLAPGLARGVAGPSLQMVASLGGWVMTVLGVIGVAPWLGNPGAALVMRGGGLGAWFASRRLTFDRRSAGRITAGVVAVVFAAGTSTGLLHLSASQNGLTTSATNLRATTLLASGGRDGEATHAGGDHVMGTVSIWVTRAKIQGWGTATVAVADCAELASVLREAPACDAGIWRTTLDGRIGPSKDTITIRGTADVPDATFAIPSEDAPKVDLSLLRHPVFMIDRAALDPTLASSLESYDALLQGDGDPDTAEALRESLGAGSNVSITTPTMYLQLRWSPPEAGIARAVQWAASLAIAIAAASLLVALVGAVHERRRPLAVLAATGVGAGTIRRSYLLQAMLPLGAGVLLALVCTAIVVRAYASISNNGAGAWAAMLPGLRIAAVALLGGLVATALTLPAIGRSIAPEALHAE